MGVQAPRRCGNCLKCKECSFRGQQLSQQEQYEYHVIESKVKYDQALRCFRVEYPFLEDPMALSKNFGQVVKIAEREERKLERDGLLECFNQEFEKMINLGTLVELSNEDMEFWKGAVHYVSLQHVIKNESTTTPLRIVTNSSLSDKRGVSLNSILMKGPNTLSNTWEILNRWRIYEIAMCSDVTKAYYALHTGEVEKHVRRVVWRYGDHSQLWRIFAFCTVSFGDQPTVVLLEVAIKKTSEMFWTIDPEAAHKIMTDRYVDDIASGGFRHQISRFVGKEMADFKCDGTISTILSHGSLQLKVIVTSGEGEQEKLKKLGNSVLGLGWNPPTDTIYVKFNVNLSQKGKGKGFLGPDLNEESLMLVDKRLLTQRKLLSVINGIYDPLGLVTPVTIRLKVAFRNLFKCDPALNWDDPIPSADQETWYKLIEMLVKSKSIVFPRATRPPNAFGKSQMVCFFDGSDVAYASVIYVRWILDNGSVVIRLMSCKSRVTPLQRISTPRSSLNDALLASRLVLSTLRSLSPADEIPERVWITGDSECTLASIEKVSAAFGEYFGNRIGEVLDNQAKIEQFCPVGLNGEW